MNIAVCDDSRDFRDHLENAIKDYFDQQNQTVHIFDFSCGEELVESATHFDMAFVDVEMGDLNGIETCKRLKQKNPYIIIILVTSYDSYIDDAFKLQAFRFLSKPLDDSRLYSALKDARELFTNEVVAFYDAASSRNVKINVNDIIFCEVDNRKTKLVTVKGTFCSNQKIPYWKNRIKSSYFVCPHASYYVNLNYAVLHKRKLLVLAEKDEKGMVKKLYPISIAPKKQAEIKKQFFTILGRR